MKDIVFQLMHFATEFFNYRKLIKQIEIFVITVNKKRMVKGFFSSHSRQDFSSSDHGLYQGIPKSPQIITTSFAVIFKSLLSKFYYRIFLVHHECRQLYKYS